MRLAIMQPYFMPYIGYFQLINAVDKFVIYDDVNFINKGWINRNYIQLNGEKKLFTIPLIKASQNKLIKEIEIVPDEKWKIKFLSLIMHAYKKAPYYNEAYRLLEEIIYCKNRNISKFLVHSITQVLKYLEIQTELIQTSSKYLNNNLKDQKRILNICQIENATQYMNPIGGIELYDKKLFQEHGIKLSFLESKNIEYTQYDNIDIPYLSMIDLMMFNSKEEIVAFLNKYNLK